MNLREFSQTYTHVFETIEESVAGKKITPALILLYSAMDGFCGLIDDKSLHDGKLLMDWSKKWMLAKYPLPCNEKDICYENNRILNKVVQEPDLKDLKSAKEIFYVSGNADLQFLQNLVYNTGKSEKAVAVRLEDLVNSFKNGVNDYLKDIEKDEVRKREFEEKARRFNVLCLN